MKILHILVFICAFCISGCTNNTAEIKYKESSFSFSDSLKNKKLLIDSAILNRARDIMIVDSLLLILDNNNTQFLHVFNKNNGSHIKSVINRGKGPCELLNPTSTFSRTADNIILFDPNIKKIILYPINKLSSNTTENFAQEVTLSQMSYFITDITSFGNDYIVQNGYTTSRFGLYNSNTHSISTTCSTVPRLVDNIEINHKLLRYSLSMAVKPDKSKFVSTTYIGGVLEIFNTTSDSMTSSKLLTLSEPIYKTNGDNITWAPESNIGFLDIDATNDYIYTIYCGFKGKEQGVVKPRLHIYDWSGAPQKEYYCPDHIVAIAIDANTVFAITKDEERGYTICKYEL